MCRQLKLCGDTRAMYTWRCVSRPLSISSILKASQQLVAETILSGYTNALEETMADISIGGFNFSCSKEPEKNRAGFTRSYLLTKFEVKTKNNTLDVYYDGKPADEETKLCFLELRRVLQGIIK